ncbi:Protein GVQW1 [Plecturocebus cupreus]
MLNEAEPCGLPLETVPRPAIPQLRRYPNLVEMGFHHVGQADLELLTSGDPPASASQSLGLQALREPQDVIRSQRRVEGPDRPHAGRATLPSTNVKGLSQRWPTQPGVVGAKASTWQGEASAPAKAAEMEIVIIPALRPLTQLLHSPGNSPVPWSARQGCPLELAPEEPHGMSAAGAGCQLALEPVLFALLEWVLGRQPWAEPLQSTDDLPVPELDADTWEGGVIRSKPLYYSDPQFPHL